MGVLLTIGVGLLACGVNTCSLGRSFTNKPAEALANALKAEPLLP